MLGLGSIFREADFVAPSRDGKYEPTIWGDEWAEGSVQVLWYPCNWQNVSHDELALLIPSLTAGNSSRSPSDLSGPTPFLRRALLARLHHTVRALSIDGTAGAIEHTRNEIANSKFLTAVDVHREWRESAAAYSQMYGAFHPGRVSRWPFQSDSLSQRRTASEQLHELAVLACLDLFLQHSLSPNMDIGRQGDSYGETEILLAAIHSGVNPAYVYPQYAFMHEQFTLGAWLGHLHRGRAAIMPYFVAETIVDRFSRKSGSLNLPGARSDRLLVKYGDIAVGQQRLMRIARRVQASGEAAIVKPRKRQWIPYSDLLACFETFAGSVSYRSALQPAN